MTDNLLIYDLPGVEAGITLRNFNFEKLKNFHKNLSLAEQVHGSDVAIVRNDSQAIVADAQLTDCHDLCLVVKTADCLPVLIVDPLKKVIGTVHAGRRGTLAGILQKTLQLMINLYQSSPTEIILHFGPHITKQYYQIAPEIFFDILENNYQQALAVGILKDKIINSGFCSYRDSDKFYSYRRENKTTLRNYSFIKIK